MKLLVSNKETRAGELRNVERMGVGDRLLSTASLELAASSTPVSVRSTGVAISNRRSNTILGPRTALKRPTAGQEHFL